MDSGLETWHSTLVQDLFDAVGQPQRWPAVLTRLAVRIEARAFCVSVAQAANPAANPAATPAANLASFYAQLRCCRLRDGLGFVDLPASDWPHRHAVADDLRLDAVLLRSGQPSLHLRFVRDAGEPPFGADERAALAQLIDPLRRAIRQAEREAERSAELIWRNATQGLASLAALVLDDGGRVLWCNRRARQRMDASQGLCWRDDRLVLAAAGDHALRLASALNRVADRDEQVRMPLAGDGAELLLLPLAPAGRPATLLGLIRSQRSRQRLDVLALQSAFALVASSIAQGATVPDAAADHVPRDATQRCAESFGSALERQVERHAGSDKLRQSKAAAQRSAVRRAGAAPQPPKAKPLPDPVEG